MKAPTSRDEVTREEQAPDEAPEPAATPMDEPAPDAEPMTEPEAPEPEPSEAGTRGVGDSIPAADAGRPGEAESPDEHSPGSDLERAERARDEYLDLAQRTRAELDNYRKRVARETADAERRGTLRLAEGLLPVLDNLERALLAAEEDDSELARGMRLVHGELLATLNRTGLESFDPAGAPFDPTEHEAVTTVPASDHEPGVIAEVLTKGYRLGDQVVRAARVVVAK